MNSSQTFEFVEPQSKRLESPDRERLFYTGAAALLLILMFIEFQQFYLHGKAYPERELTPPIRMLLILHGCTMTGWMLLFLSQQLLVVFSHSRVHMIFGRVRAALAACVEFLAIQILSICFLRDPFSSRSAPEDDGVRICQSSARRSHATAPD